jgi:hypothetical protein
MGVSYLQPGAHTSLLPEADVILVIDCELPWIEGNATSTTTVGGGGTGPPGSLAGSTTSLNNYFSNGTAEDSPAPLPQERTVINGIPSPTARIFVLSSSSNPLNATNMGSWHVPAEIIACADAEVALGQLLDGVREVDGEVRRAGGNGIIGSEFILERMKRLRARHDEWVAVLDRLENDWREDHIRHHHSHSRTGSRSASVSQSSQSIGHGHGQRIRPRADSFAGGSSSAGTSTSKSIPMPGRDSPIAGLGANSPVVSTSALGLSGIGVGSGAGGLNLQGRSISPSRSLNLRTHLGRSQSVVNLAGRLGGSPPSHSPTFTQTGLPPLSASPLGASSLRDGSLGREGSGSPHGLPPSLSRATGASAGSAAAIGHGTSSLGRSNTFSFRERERERYSPTTPFSALPGGGSSAGVGLATPALGPTMGSRSSAPLKSTITLPNILGMCQPTVRYVFYIVLTCFCSSLLLFYFTSRVLGVLRKVIRKDTPSGGGEVLVLNEGITNYAAIWAHGRGEVPGGEYDFFDFLLCLF